MTLTRTHCGQLVGKGDLWNGSVLEEDVRNKEITRTKHCVVCRQRTGVRLVGDSRSDSTVLVLLILWLHESCFGEVRLRLGVKKKSSRFSSVKTDRVFVGLAKRLGPAVELSKVPT